MGSTLRAPIASPFQMSGTTVAIANPDVHADIELDLAMEAGIQVRSTQPPHPSLIVDVPSGYPEDLGTYGTPDTLDIEDVLSINGSPLSAISTSRIDATDMSVFVGPGTSMSVDLDDRATEILDIAAVTSETEDPPPIGACRTPGIPSTQYEKNFVHSSVE